ncbi:MAG: peptidoglycan-associated lipoprotein Pal [Deltaproteobacteria bacterium]|nr:peptidoglycan-associated lipoprotein Pal [Candidatus Anaeroferrophillacea bacterium]
MKQKHTLILVCLALVLAFALSACSTCKTDTLAEETVSEPAGMTTPQDVKPAEPASQPGISESGLAADGAGKPGIGDRLAPIYFDFDKFNLKDTPRATLAKHAQWLKDNARAVIRIEGNCDERGSNEYNLALGERRAASAKKYLVYLGISPDRLETISYGEERPLCADHNEDCWWKNRRDDFAIVAK